MSEQDAGLTYGRIGAPPDSRCDFCRETPSVLTLREQTFDGSGPLGGGRPVTVRMRLCEACDALLPGMRSSR